ncbi:hypothetical protein M407DRAFT_71837 [Tulasnella calospora MUT 4182]|uniref:PHD-type domain-containing protein n=1 Tax=Tulasnella calospora MUT 4182 TaxID=1051891 RepID=A0A0C3M3Z5_9AGAM|nr:hypothetical protein M407DRAFT_71837 [Tulasnella calospora MUT 4182]
MVSCCKCGRSGHPSCLKIEQIGDVIRSYDWTCMECKTCEVCNKKGREVGRSLYYNDTSYSNRPP